MPMNETAATGTPGVVRRIAPLLLASIAISCGQESQPPTPVERPPTLVLYASVPAERVSDVARAYAEETGVIVNYMVDTDQVLIDKLIRKEHFPGADVLLISGAGNLAQAVDENVLRPVATPALERIAPARRDPDGFWYALGARAQMIVYDTRTVDGATLAGYAELAGETWAGRLCLERSLSERSRSLVAALIAEHGERQAEIIVRGWRANLAQSVFDEQHALLEAIEAGRCAVGIVGSDAVARSVVRGAATHLGLHFPDAAHAGTQVQLLAAGVVRHANDPDGATQFLEWLASDAGQRALHRQGFDYPTAAGVDAAAPIDTWTGFDESPIGASRIGFIYPDAVLLVERARYR